MVELVKASQVIQTKKLPPTQGTSKPPSESYGKTKKPKKMIRVAGGQLWEDSSLMNWDHNDFRLFCGDLGNDVTDEVCSFVLKHLPVLISSVAGVDPDIFQILQLSEGESGSGQEKQQVERLRFCQLQGPG